MQIPNEIISALIGAASALLVVLIKDAILDSLRKRKERKSELVRQRLEEAYVPLNYYLYALAVSERGNTENLRREMTAILTKGGHLLSEETLSGLYVLLDQADPTEFDEDVVEGFFREYKLLKNEFYRDRSSSY